MYKIRNLTFEDWVDCDLGRDDVAFWATRFVKYRFGHDTLTYYSDRPPVAGTLS